MQERVFFSKLKNVGTTNNPIILATVQFNTLHMVHGSCSLSWWFEMSRFIDIKFNMLCIDSPKMYISPDNKALGLLKWKRKGETICFFYNFNNNDDFHPSIKKI